MAKMKLYRISRVQSTVVAALNPKDAQNVSNDCDWGDPDEEIQIRELKTVPELMALPGGNWTEAIPIGRQDDNPDELTCRDILEGRLDAPLKKHEASIVFWYGPDGEKKVKAVEEAIEKLVKGMGFEVVEGRGHEG